MDHYLAEVGAALQKKEPQIVEVCRHATAAGCAAGFAARLSPGRMSEGHHPRHRRSRMLRHALSIAIVTGAVMLALAAGG
ncbi:MAG: hypothetical protein ACREKH_03510, partial [Candidatus Rokuibacteriota bacterium]